MENFLELKKELFSEAIVIVDIDGTLIVDGGEKLDKQTKSKLRELSAVAEVFLFSNGSSERTKIIAEDADVSFIDSKYKKPSRRVAQNIVHGGKKIFVIGDKFLTDGLFALNIGAQFIQIGRVIHKNDSLFTKCVYTVDNCFGLLGKPIFSLLPYIVLMRPFQWIKNILVITPVFFAGTLFRWSLVDESLLAIIIFCTTSSAMYIFNDIHDVAQDRLHPTKRFRPLASGAVSLRGAIRLLLILVVITIFGIYLIPEVTSVMLTYVILNILYSSRLKHVAILDLVFVSFFYVLRVLAGGKATETYVSPWIVLCVLFGALFMVIGKRRSEFLHVSKRKVLETYSKTALDFLLAVSATLVITSYGLYSVLGSKSTSAVFSTFFVVIVIFRLLNKMYLSSDDAEYPETLIFKDRIVLVSIFFWAGYMFTLLYN